MKLIALFSLCLSLYSADSIEFNKWKKKLINRAMEQGFSKKFSTKVLDNTFLDNEILEKQQNQTLFDETRDFNAFIDKWLRDEDKRISTGRELLRKHFELLSKVEEQFQVEKEIIVALWGVETFYGQITGDYDLINVFANLSFNGKRKNFFLSQLDASMWALYNGYATRKKLKGSWAGATGQCQFMPSNIVGLAYDFDKDGKKDIWTNLGDIFASIANYLKRNGWVYGKSIGSLVENSKGIKLKDNTYYSKSFFVANGFVPWRKTSLGNGWVARRISDIPMKNAPVVLRGSNYLPLLRWNRSSLFAALNIILLKSF